MLNLVHLTEQRIEILVTQKGPLLVATDPLTGTTFIAHSSSIWAHSSNQKLWSCRVEEQGVVGIKYLSELEALFVVFETGSAAVIREGIVEYVNSSIDTISAVQWSPDEDACVFVTRAAQVLLMNPINLECIMRTPLPTNKVADESVEVIWRSDGQYFAVSFVKSTQRCVAIFERDSLKLNGLIEDRFDLCQVMDWQPNGRHLYLASLNKDRSPEICLYEVNGLPHGSFSLRSKDSVIQSMKWSIDSQLLAVILSNENNRKLQIWRRSNWHWYLKFEKWFEKEFEFLHPFWDVQELHKLHFISQTSSVVELHTLEFAFEYNVSSNGTSAVIDGNYLKLTPLRWIEIPPPLAAATVEFTQPVQSIAFSTCIDEKIAVLLSSGQIEFVCCSNEDRWDNDMESNLQSFNSDDEIDEVFLKPFMMFYDFPLTGLDSAYSILWPVETHLVLFGKLKEDHELKDAICVVNAKEGFCDQSVKTQSLPFPLLKPVGFRDSLLYLQSFDGGIYTGRISDGVIEFTHVVSFPFPCPSTLLMESNAEVKIAGLSSTGKLYFGDHLVHEKVTSMIQRQIQRSQFLLMTTKDNQLLIKPIEDPHQTKYDSWNGNKGPHPSIYQRSIEQGAQLIASPPGDTKVTLQMPRGNLETIHLRLFVLLELTAALEQECYSKAWKLATEHRVDLNVFVDYNLDQFLNKIPQFINAVYSPDELCDLMIALQKDSVFASGGIYYGSIPIQNTQETSNHEVNKINSVCCALRSSMMKLDALKYSKAVVISHARCCPPELEEALEFIKSIKLDELRSNRGIDDDSSPAGETLKFLMLYVDVSELYQVALGRYDLNLAYMVITHAQRDPGEYMNELTRFSEAQNEHYCRALIDMQLKRFSNAIRHLVEAGSGYLEQAIDLARDQGLFHELLEQIEARGEEQKLVLVQYGHWLKTKGMMEDSGAAFLAAEELQLAMEAYQASADWKMVFIIGKKLNLTSEELQELYMEVYEELRSMGKIMDASIVAREYLDQFEEAILLLIDARQWKEALRLSYHLNKESLIESVLAPSAVSTLETYLHDFEQTMESINSYSIRLKQVREKREAMESAIGSTGRKEMEEAASTVAGLSIYTERTSPGGLLSSTGTPALTTGGRKPKLNTKSKKKRYKIKQGSPEEESALELHIKELKPKGEVLKEVSELNEVLIGLGYFNDARKLQSSLDSLMKLHKVDIHYLQFLTGVI
eukprot:g471.t1